MAQNLKDFVPTLRLPITSSRQMLYISGIPGEGDDSLRVVFPGRHFLPLALFRLALERAQRGESVDRGRIVIETFVSSDGIRLCVEIGPRDDAGGEPFIIVLDPDVVEEIAVLFRIASAIQDQYRLLGQVQAFQERHRATTVIPPAESMDGRLTVRAPAGAQDGPLFTIEGDDGADDVAAE